ncbi:MAG: hypothetical protein DMG65_07920 [Candidatus Angelobacter sp. Gp1-AA117]|nr:MAG: hypothetical protein DMG65_07920 [Candidatus Angelobacter sp. Gp1-AA117]
MRRCPSLPAILLVVFLVSIQLPAQDKKGARQTAGSAIIWEDPGDIKSKDLFYGPGSKKDEPHGTFKFIKEDKHAHSPKLDVEDENGKTWRAKMGAEAQPEPVATRLLWAVGYFTNENYYLPEMTVTNLPGHLTRGQEFVTAPGHVKSVRLQRHPKHEKKAGTWNWRQNRFLDTREFNGLRVMMALISNWDLKDDNNAIYEDESSREQFYEVTDVGSSFGTPGRRYRDAPSKNNLKEYRKQKFISKITPTYVDFDYPHLPPLLYVFAFPYYSHEIRIRWVGKHIPRQDAKWIGSLLAQLTPEQIHDAFRAGGYSPDKIEAYSAVLQKRIAELNQL